MTIAADDQRHLRASLIAFALLVAIGGGAAFATLRLVTEEAEAHRRARARHDDSAARLARADREIAALRRHTALYVELVARFGDGERRADWIERIGRIRDRRRIGGLRFELSPRRPLAAAVPPGNDTAGGYEFMASTMQLHMRLRHEGDLLGFFADLGDGLRARVHVRNCSLKPAGGGLDAECTLDWITLRERQP